MGTSLGKSGQKIKMQNCQDYTYPTVSLTDYYLRIVMTQRKKRQAGAELCQAQHSLSFDLDTNYLGLITQPAVAGARSLAELQIRIYWYKGMALLGYLLARS